jgi:hypothetical protein
LVDFHTPEKNIVTMLQLYIKKSCTDRAMLQWLDIPSHNLSEFGRQGRQVTRNVDQKIKSALQRPSLLFTNMAEKWPQFTSKQVTVS